MRRALFLAGIGAAIAPTLFAAASVSEVAPRPGAAVGAVNASPIYGVTIPPGYRRWTFIAPAQEPG